MLSSNSACKISVQPNTSSKYIDMFVNDCRSSVKDKVTWRYELPYTEMLLNKQMNNLVKA